MKKIFFIFIALFAITACSDPVVDCDPNTDELCLKNYVGEFSQFTTGDGPGLIITKKGKDFHIINKGDYGGVYLCTFDGRIMEDWGDGEPHPVMGFDCKVLGEENSSLKEPYIVLYFNDKDDDSMSINIYWYGRKYYKKCSADEDKQACKYWGNNFYRVN